MRVRDQQVVDMLTTQASGWSEYKEKWPGMELKDLAPIMRDLQKFKEALKEQLSVINVLFDDIRINIIPAVMEADGIKTATFVDVGRVSITADIYASIVADKKEDAYAWLEEEGLGDLIQETINASSLKATLKDRLKTGGDIPQELFKVTPYSRASITKV